MPEKYARLNLNLIPDVYVRMRALSVCIQKPVVNILTEAFADYYEKQPKETRVVCEAVVREARKHEEE